MTRSEERRVGKECVSTSSALVTGVQTCALPISMGRTEGCKPARASQSQKPSLSPDRSLQLDSVKSESLVIADQHCCGEYVPGPCTHRPSHHGSLLHQKQVA